MTAANMQELITQLSGTDGGLMLPVLVAAAVLTTVAGIAGLLETVGGSLLLVGLFTRPVAFILSGEMAFAYFIGHAGRGFWPVLNQGAPAVIFCFLWLYISAAGGGPWSLDAAWKRR